MTIKDSAPMHVKEGISTSWKRVFLYFPHPLEQGGWAWWRYTWRRRFFAPIWFDPAPLDGWYEYSDVKLGRWEIDNN